jgi:hypothetical protein
MRPLPIAGCLVFLSLSGCASMKDTSAVPTPQPTAATVAPPPDTELRAPPPSPSQPVETRVEDTSTHSSVPAGHSEPKQSVGPASGSTLPKSSSTAANRPVKQEGAAPALPTAPSVTPNKGPETPTLNLADLEQRLRDTHAIGVFTKLSLKNQVDDLLNAFRSLYKGPNKHPPAELRQRYDLLLMKVLSLLQDSDPSLAAAISSSREAIWGILSDPDKFAAI